MSVFEMASFVLRHPRRAYYQWRSGKRFDTRFVYSVDNVAPQGPMGNAISYFDHRVLREVLTEISGTRKIRRALEVGCGYGRVLLVLGEFADDVVGVEREPELAAAAQRLFPEARIVRQPSIVELPSFEDGSCDFAMTFTVLQHMIDADVRRVLDEIKRVVAPGGFALITEKVIPGDETEHHDDRSRFLSKHRPVAVYQGWMAPFTLVSTRLRPAPAAWNRNSGTAMLFRREA